MLSRITFLVACAATLLGCSGGATAPTPPVRTENPAPAPEQPRSDSENPAPDSQSPEIAGEPPLPNAQDPLPAEPAEVAGEGGASPGIP